MKKNLLFGLLFIGLILNVQSQMAIDYTIPQRPIFTISLPSDVVVNEENVTEYFKLYLINSENISNVPVIGDYRIEAGVLYYQSRFNLSRSATFRIQLKDSSFNFRLPEPTEDHTLEVNTVYPVKKQVPSNILTFYVEFNTPMIPDPDAHEYVELLNADNETISLPWRQKSFWINNNKTLVLMVHPGRVKNGIQSTYNLEPVFITGNTVKLKINPGIRAVNQSNLKAPYIVEYTIGPMDTTSPVFKRDNLQFPTANTQSPLFFEFSESMDFGLIYKWVTIKLEGEIVEGVFASKDGQNWTFTPDQQWNNGNYTLEIANKAGDPCHNQQDRLFETNTEQNLGLTTLRVIEFQL